MDRRTFLAAAAALAGSTSSAPALAADGGKPVRASHSVRPITVRSPTTTRSSRSSATSWRSGSRSAGTAPAASRR